MLVNKYRPKRLKEIQGNLKTVEILENIFKKEVKEIPNIWLLTGETGCGKTTIARIIKEKLNCKGVDYKEIDSADFRGIDSIRAIRESMHFLPMDGLVRIWLLDECHQLTKDAQNILLKALEEPPPHVYFILATTDPQKLLPTLKGRCVSIKVNPLSTRETLMLLRNIARKEKKIVPLKVLENISELSLGKPRNAIQMLEKIIDLKPESMEEAIEFEEIINTQVIDLCRGLMNKNTKWKEISIIIKNLINEDLEKIRQAVIGYCSNTLLKSDNPQAYIILDCFREPFWNNGKSGLILACYEAKEMVKNK